MWEKEKQTGGKGINFKYQLLAKFSTEAFKAIIVNNT